MKSITERKRKEEKKKIWKTAQHLKHTKDAKRKWLRLPWTIAVTRERVAIVTVSVIWHFQDGWWRLCGDIFRSIFVQEEGGGKKRENEAWKFGMNLWKCRSACGIILLVFF